MEVCPFEAYSTQVRVNTRVLFPPPIPTPYSSLKNIEMFLTDHTVSSLQAHAACVLFAQHALVLKQVYPFTRKDGRGLCVIKRPFSFRIEKN
jgi:hypothetical protein